MRWPFSTYAELAAHMRLEGQLPSRRFSTRDDKRHLSHFLCRECGEDDPDRFYSAYKTLCGLCRSRLQRANGTVRKS